MTKEIEAVFWYCCESAVDSSNRIIAIFNCLQCLFSVLQENIYFHLLALNLNLKFRFALLCHFCLFSFSSFTGKMFSLFKESKSIFELIHLKCPLTLHKPRNFSLTLEPKSSQLSRSTNRSRLMWILNDSEFYIHCEHLTV